MGKQSRRPNRRYRNRDWFDGEDEVAYIVAWYRGDENREPAKTGSHDALLRTMEAADAETGPVRWLDLDRHEALQFLRLARDETTETEMLNHYRRIERMLHQRGGRMMVAMCHAVPSPEPAE